MGGASHIDRMHHLASVLRRVSSLAWAVPHIHPTVYQSGWLAHGRRPRHVSATRPDGQPHGQDAVAGWIYAGRSDLGT